MQDLLSKVLLFSSGGLAALHEQSVIALKGRIQILQNECLHCHAIVHEARNFEGHLRT